MCRGVFVDGTNQRYKWLIGKLHVRNSFRREHDQPPTCQSANLKNPVGTTINWLRIKPQPLYANICATFPAR